MSEEILEGEYIAREEVEQRENRPISEVSIEEILTDTSW